MNICMYIFIYNTPRGRRLGSGGRGGFDLQSNQNMKQVYLDESLHLQFLSSPLSDASTNTHATC